MATDVNYGCASLLVHQVHVLTDVELQLSADFFMELAQVLEIDEVSRGSDHQGDFFGEAIGGVFAQVLKHDLGEGRVRLSCCLR